MQLGPQPYEPEAKDRHFPRFSYHHPLCPKHKRRLKASKERIPTFISMSVGYSKNATRKVYRCPVTDCHYCLAADSQPGISSFERKKRCYGRYLELD